MEDIDDDVGDLLALMDEDEEAETSTLEDEYFELEKKMKEIKEKMKQKKGNSPGRKKNENCSPEETTETSQKSSPDNKENVTDSKSLPKSSFLAAFADAPFANTASVTNTASASLNSNISRKLDSEKTKNVTSSFYGSSSKRQVENNQFETDLPPQKKRRVANTTQAPGPMGHPFTESLRGSVSSPRTPMGPLGNLLGPQFGAKSTPPQKQKPAAAKEPVVVEIERFSRIRLKKCFVPGVEMQQRMTGKRYLKLSLIRSTMKLSEETDWVTIGVVAKQLERQTAKNGKPFSIWNLTDLDDCTKTVSFFLFGAVHEKLTKQMAVGSVIGLLNPTIMPPKKDDPKNSFDDTPALTVDVADRTMHIGLASDLGWCMATKWRNKQPAGKCLAFINKQVSDVCVFHMKSKYKKSSARRSELQGSVAAPVAKKFKDSMWNKVKNDQFFYGGKVYSATPNSVANSTKPKEPKVKLTKFLSNHADLAAEGKRELMERSKVMKALSGIEEDHSVSGCSPAFAEMLTSGDMAAGSRQYLNHLNNLKKEEEFKKKAAESKPQTAAEFLKERGNLIKSKSKTTSNVTTQPVKKTGSLLSQLKSNAANSRTKITGNNSFVSPADIKKMTADMVRMKKLELAKISSPKLGANGPKLGDGSCNGEIDLFGEWGSPKNSSSSKNNASLAKKKAIAKLRNDTGNVVIQKSDPNKGVLKQVKNVQNSDNMKNKILQKVELNLGEKKENQPQKLSPKHSKFGNLSKEEFNKILNSKSSFSREIENSQLEEEEKYFTPLIRKEMMEKKMSETYEISSKVVTCVECSYTFWGPHERCKELKHHLNWKNAKKKFFECSNCRHRAITWEMYPSKSCAECGSEKNWRKSSMLKERDVKILDSEVLLIRGLEHGRFLNSLA
uniref:protein MCM10 homolog n=1 Tax=Styela clava TaxID=7725 RepID=UPI0019397972|nr:protein MCM10 homolog [Styela clava]